MTTLCKAALAEFDASLTDPTKISVHQTATGCAVEAEVQDVYEKSASRDDGLDPFENGIKWTTEQISSWTEKRGAA